MLRLRTTASLSALALAIGIAGSAWLCTLTAGWAGPSARDFAAARLLQPSHHEPRHRPPARRWHGPASVLTAPRASLTAAAAPMAARPAPALVPLSTPDPGQPWYLLRDHLRGQVLMHLHIDGHGQVLAARVARSSGDPVLDRHAVRSVRGWRFRVPAAWPEGFSGDLPMRFTVGSERLASMP